MDIDKMFKRDIINGNQPYLNQAYSQLAAMEAGQMCVSFNSTQSLISEKECVAMSEQISKQGLSTYYFDIFKTVK